MKLLIPPMAMNKMHDIDPCSKVTRHHLGDEGRGRGGLVLPVGGELLRAAVVAGETVDTGLNENEPELGILVLPELLEVLPHSHGLLDQVVQILGELGGKAVSLQDAENLVASDELDLTDTVRITENHANLRGGETLLGELADQISKLGRGGLQPRRGRALEGLGGARDTLARSMHTTHVRKMC